MGIVINVSVPCAAITPGAIDKTTASVGEPSPLGSLHNTAVNGSPFSVGSGKAGVPHAIEIELIKLLPPVTANLFKATKVPPLVRPIESSAVPSSTVYVSRGLFPTVVTALGRPVLRLNGLSILGAAGGALACKPKNPLTESRIEKPAALVPAAAIERDVIVKIARIADLTIVKRIERWL